MAGMLKNSEGKTSVTQITKLGVFIAITIAFLWQAYSGGSNVVELAWVLVALAGINRVSGDVRSAITSVKGKEES